jgi:hypothetical protein
VASYPAAHYFLDRTSEKEGQLTEVYINITRIVQLDPLKKYLNPTSRFQKSDCKKRILPIPELDRDPEAPLKPTLLEATLPEL